MNYTELVLNGFISPDTKDNLDSYFLRQFKKAEKEHYTEDEFFKGCFNVTYELKMQMEIRHYDKVEWLANQIDIRQAIEKSNLNANSESANECLKKCKALNDEINRISLKDFPISLLSIKGVSYQGQIYYSNLEYINSSIEKAKNKASVIVDVTTKQPQKEKVFNENIDNYYNTCDVKIVNLLQKALDENGKKNPCFIPDVLFNYKNACNKEVNENTVFKTETKRRLEKENNIIQRLFGVVFSLYYDVCAYKEPQSNSNVKNSIYRKENEVIDDFKSINYQILFISSLIEKEQYKEAIAVRNYLKNKLLLFIKHSQTMFSINLLESPLAKHFNNHILSLDKSINTDEINLLLKLKEPEIVLAKVEPQQEKEILKVDSYPVFNTEQLPKLLDVLKGHFSKEDNSFLVELLSSNIIPNKKLFFRDNANKLTDVFKKLKEHNLITNCNKTILIEWILNNFQYKGRNDKKEDFKKKTIESSISTKINQPCKKPLIKIVDGIIIKT
ncbi:hypothetical protein [Tenacibaculum insulae]|uniref:hypothetical protein n=1 Tax=Tenacibaculum insulae TaxID=2029677 RepID=UPI003AB65B6C